MIDTMKSLVRERDTCVLATTQNDEPHCSLMSYVTDPDCTALYMVTHRQTKKYRNLVENPRVSLLIDTREVAGPDRSTIKALTVGGRFEKVADPSKKVLVHGQLLEKHPQLRDFLNDEGAEIFSVVIESFQLLEGIKDSSFVKIET